MKIEDLKENMVFKNYKELCNFLGVKIAGGNSKQAQLKELARHCCLEREGHSFRVKEVYEAPVKDKANRGRKGFYSELLQALVMDYLVAQNISEICITRNNILCKVEMMQENFVYDEKKIKLVQAEMNIPEGVLFDFFNITSKTFKNALENALKNLMQKELIHYEAVVMFAYQTKNNPRLLYREVTPQELQVIQQLQYQVQEQFGYASMKEITFSKSRSKKFSQQVMNLYNKQQANSECILQFTYSAYKITLNNQLEEEKRLTYIIQDPSRKEFLKRQLNQLLCEQLRKNAEKRHQEALDADKTDYITETRRSKNYVAHSEELIKRLILIARETASQATFDTN